MKVYVVYPDFGGEGNGEPTCVFSTREKAEKHNSDVSKSWRNCNQIKEIEVDEENDWL